MCTYCFTISVATRSLSAVSKKQSPCIDDNITNEIVQAVFDENQLVTTMNEHENESRYGNTIPFTSTPVQSSSSAYVHSGMDSEQESLSPHSNSSSLEQCHGVVSSIEDSNDSVQFKSNGESYDSSNPEEYRDGFWNHSVSNTMHNSDSSDDNQPCEVFTDKMHDAISVLNDNAHRITRE